MKKGKIIFSDGRIYEGDVLNTRIFNGKGYIMDYD
jgi:hypothetical protein